ncbi:MAG: helicase-related protein, partial [Desulfobacterales bacterium]|nr:helicase-related protein [Desulfobacterales bacterium]MDX2512751.1 helicase-related protein [Desulfobacterales bacterium]
VATDVAARGLDIVNLPLVINYDIPRTPQDYIHRIGRTCRASEKGLAISLVSQDEKHYLQTIEDWLKQKIPVQMVDGYTEDSDVPDFVLLRPNSKASEIKADKDLKEIVAKRTASKRNKRARRAKSSRSKSKPYPSSKRIKSGKKPSRSPSPTSKPSIQGRPRHKR